MDEDIASPIEKLISYFITNIPEAFLKPILAQSLSEIDHLLPEELSPENRKRKALYHFVVSHNLSLAGLEGALIDTENILNDCGITNIPEIENLYVHYLKDFGLNYHHPFIEIEDYLYSTDRRRDFYSRLVSTPQDINEVFVAWDKLKYVLQAILRFYRKLFAIGSNEEIEKAIEEALNTHDVESLLAKLDTIEQSFKSSDEQKAICQHICYRDTIFDGINWEEHITRLVDVKKNAQEVAADLEAVGKEYQRIQKDLRKLNRVINHRQPSPEKQKQHDEQIRLQRIELEKQGDILDQRRYKWAQDIVDKVFDAALAVFRSFTFDTSVSPNTMVITTYAEDKNGRFFYGYLDGYADYFSRKHLPDVPLSWFIPTVLQEYPFKEMFFYLAPDTSTHTFNPQLIPEHEVIPPSTLVAEDGKKGLLHELLTLFSLDELRALCLELGIEYEDLGGDTRSAKSMALIGYMERRSKLEALTEKVQLLRPANSSLPVA